MESEKITKIKLELLKRIEQLPPEESASERKELEKILRVEEYFRNAKPFTDYEKDDECVMCGS